jgi:putative colanic acid biosynthesis UDP-glucose lipid carrier transferase
MQRRVDFDLEYIRTRSLGTDIWIILRTFTSVIRRVNAY